MKLTSAMRSGRFRLACWTFLAGGIAVAAVPPMQAGAAGPRHKPAQSTRRSTDPPVAAKGKLGQDLFLAIDHRDTTGVEALLKRGADPNARNGLEFVPLYMASASHQPEVMQALLNAGADAKAESTYGTPLTFAAATANLEGAKMLLARGADIDSPRTDGITVLIMAATAGSPEFIGELLQHKPNINAKNDAGETALAVASNRGYFPVAQMLVEAGAKVDTRNADQQTPLMEAAATGHADVVDLLLKKGANPNARDAKGRTALALAASYGDYPDVAKALLAGGAKANIADAKGRTAKTLAASRGYGETATLLGAKGVSVKTRSPREAAGASLGLLQASMAKFNNMAGCVSCHQDGLGRMTTGVAREKGFAVDKSVLRVQQERLRGMLTALQPLHTQALKNPEVMKQVPLIEINEVNTADGWVLAGMAAQKDPATPGAAAMAMVLARQQSPQGFWSFSLPRVPMQSSFFTFTALAVRSLSTYAPKSASAETAQRIARARGWLLNAEPKDSEDRAGRLLGLKWSGASQQDLQKAGAAIRADQRPDGGWSQLPNMHSDAYATGQALYALHVGAGVPVTDPVYKRGVQYLLRTQDDDGSWFVSKRALPANNYFDAGFPHGESQYASFNGTCWATLALMQTVDGKRRSK